MRVLALLSGGKDSVCAAEVVRSWGWDVVGALALHPAQDDAWMFHTPNLRLARGVAACMGIPLEEVPVRAGPEEELEDLESALEAARRSLDLDGIVSGALASEYQRTRLEAIGHRLGLKTFTPLWHKEPSSYVRGLVASGWQVHFSRTAADGVPNAWAGTQLDLAKVEAMERHPARPHVAGEGGEFETLVTYVPGWRTRISVDDAHVQETASRATWVVDRWHLAPAEAPPAK
jgi:diphthine-ammonia ligase